MSASAENAGHLEERIAQRTREVARLALAEAVQAKAAATPPRCPKCGQPLTRKKGGATRTFESRFGPITVRRTRGWCRPCHAWRYPADAALGLEDTAGYSPGVQEIAALTVSKLPVAEASAVIERLAGVKLPRATLDREARRQGQRAEAERTQLDAQMRTAEGRTQQVRELQLELPLEPFTLVIELDAWNISERGDQWGRFAELRAGGTEPERWHWTYGATCFRLSQRAQTAGGRPVILSRGYVMTRGGLDALREQLFAEASRHGLGQASDVLVVADGAVWIWNLVDDRFPQARQRLDLFHAKAHLWAVAAELHGADTPAAHAWVKPLLAQLESGQAPRLLQDLRAALAALPAEPRAHLEREIGYFENNRHRLDYAEGKRRGEPLGSGAMESTCHQYQCRFKRPGQFWTKVGDEALLCLETFWRNGRWKHLFPHVGNFDPSRN
ncbi:MAG: ISKra4 family transposase [Opitutaceae bacterium]